jgi:deazaflavin-dependent oxidoreductase (nitroreductase family)
MSVPAPAQNVEAELFRALNALVEPWVRAGCGSPGLFPTGLIVLETTGAKSGEPRRVPLLATVFDGCVFIATVRGPRSLWVRNLAAQPRARYWVAGREHRGIARVFRPGEPLPYTAGLPPFARAAADGLLPPATLWGWTVAVIAPE